ncbi:hypothetical protein [Streptomyces sp. NPDC057623]|uniref:hypothetical protein n=1 Tax=Streptomyces sp. NPDC057623 TaxID=3346187 RepID=UPI0036C28A66
MRAAAVAASLAGALALTACSGDGGSDAREGSAEPSASASTGADTGGGTGGSAAGDLQGSWLTTVDGKAVVLMVNGKEAGLFATGGTVCSGTAGEEDGMRMIRLKCPTGGKGRTTGMVDSVGKTSLKVTWQGGVGAETYVRGDGAKLPTGLPTAGLGS